MADEKGRGKVPLLFAGKSHIETLRCRSFVVRCDEEVEMTSDPVSSEREKLLDATLEALSAATPELRDLARRIGVEYSTVQSWRSRRYVPDPENALYVAEAVEEIAKRSQKAAQRLRKVAKNRQKAQSHNQADAKRRGGRTSRKGATKKERGGK